MKKYLISLVSEQTIPNILFIKTFPEADKYVFITSSRMIEKGKSECICTICGETAGKCMEIEVDENSYSDIWKKLIEFCNQVDIRDEFIVNLTGGTKIMSIAVFDFFKNLPGQAYYIPGGKNFIEQIYPLNDKLMDITHRIKVDEFFTAYGLKISRKETKTDPEDKLLKMYDVFIKRKLPNGLLLKLREYRDSNNLDIEVFELDGFDFLINTFEVDKDKVDKHFIRFVTGGWFEEYIFHFVSKALPHSSRARNIKLPGLDNEIDVAFTLNNKIFIIESKTSIRRDGYRFLINDALYKLDSLKSKFGLYPNSFIATLDKEFFVSDAFEKSYSKRANQMNIGFLKPADLAPDRIVESFQKTFQ